MKLVPDGWDRWAKRRRRPGASVRRCARVGGLRRWRIVGGLIVAWGTIPSADPARADGPAVEALNGRVGVAYDYTQVDEQLLVLGPVTTATFFEIEQDQVGPFGGITVPVAERVGFRAGLGYRYVSIDRDVLGSDDGGGVELSTSLFVRDPELYEIGAGLDYGYVDVSNDDRHGLRGFLQGKLFFGAGDGEGGAWPAVDLDLSGSVGAANLEQSGDEEQLVQTAAGGLRLYPFDRVALRVGGRYEHLEVRDGWRVETSVGRVELDVLVLQKPALTLSPRFEGGNVDTEIVFLPHFRRSTYSAGVYVTLSFPGADSLVALNRNYY